ncbi:TetR/AcrR family transcriptional regulator [Aquincola sp. MAHUQ-54]|uniref:TetR/AcrR family transcriptional regulator n=1 Tax=Aquincola agrisoli TaxID=3119538 RepID=A0AAW9QDT1_9BURK
MARTRAATYDDQREHILAQAAALFAHQGYPGTSMNQVAAACGVSKATLYHYMRDKAELLAQIAQSHVGRLEALVAEVAAQPLPAEERLRMLITRFVREYADAQHHHRVLTEDVKFLEPAAQRQVLDGQRRVVTAFARTLAEVRPALAEQQLAKPLTMLLFGMINWMFTWLKPGGALNHDMMAPLVSDLFLGGLHAVQAPAAATAAPFSPPIHPTETAR